jgi:hypothetical protein
MRSVRAVCRLEILRHSLQTSPPAGTVLAAQSRSTRAAPVSRGWPRCPFVLEIVESFSCRHPLRVRRRTVLFSRAARRVDRRGRYSSTLARGSMARRSALPRATRRPSAFW